MIWLGLIVGERWTSRHGKSLPLPAPESPPDVSWVTFDLVGP